MNTKKRTKEAMKENKLRKQVRKKNSSLHFQKLNGRKTQKSFEYETAEVTNSFSIRYLQRVATSIFYSDHDIEQSRGYLHAARNNVCEFVFQYLHSDRGGVEGGAHLERKVGKWE